MADEADVERSQRDEVAILAVRGNLDITNSEDLRAEVLDIVNSGAQKVLVDLSSLRQIDSSGVGVLVSLFKRVGAAGGHVNFAGVRGQPLAVFRILSMDRVLKLCDTVEDAMTELRRGLR